jgi:LemA protein
MRKKFLNLFIFVMILGSSNCGYNRIQELDEQVKADMAEILNQYKRRTDLIPSLVKVVEGYADFEKQVLVDVTKARGGVGGINASPDLVNDPDGFQKFQAAQNQLGSALQRMLVVVEKYPDLKANENFRDLQAQLEGTENRIAVARGRYIKSVQEYNTYIRKIPGVMWASFFGYNVKSSFTVENEDSIIKMDNTISQPPAVDFGKK